MRNWKRVCQNKYFLVVFLLFVLLLLFTVFIKQNNKSIQIENYSFSEIQDVDYLFSDIEIENINDILMNLCVEDEQYYGFSNMIDNRVDIYQAYSTVNLATLIPEYNLELIKEKLCFLEHVNIEKFDFLNLMYYIDICNKLDIEVNYVSVNNALVNYYDEESMLFYLDDKANTVNIKLIATAMVKNMLKDNLSVEMFSPEKGIKNAYNKYSFTTENDVTLYNSGGDVLYCISVYGMENIIDKNSLKNWFEFWKKMYEEMEIDSSIAAVQYAEYLNVSKIFEPNYSSSKIQNYYDNLTVDSIEEFNELNILYNYMKKINIIENKEIVNLMKDKIGNIIEADSFVVSDIEVRETVYGVLLAKKSDFNINEAIW